MLEKHVRINHKPDQIIERKDSYVMKINKSKKKNAYFMSLSPR